MKLSEFSTDEALDALCQLTPHIASITTDQAFIDEVGKIVDTKDKSVYGMYALMVDRISAIAPILLRDHRADVYGVLSVLNQKSPQEIAAQSVWETFSQLREVFQDQELGRFFKSFLGRVKSGSSGPSGEAPGSASAAT